MLAIRGPSGKTCSSATETTTAASGQRAFKTKSAAEKWSREYVDAERRSRLREFLLGSDAPEVLPDATPVAELFLEWLASDAHPDSVGGLARSTWDGYRSLASRHIIGNPIERRVKKTAEILEVQPAIKPLAGATQLVISLSSSLGPRTSSSAGYRRCARLVWVPRSRRRCGRSSRPLCLGQWRTIRGRCRQIGA